ncbi:MAG: cytochrome c biogenesis protein CcdA [Alphaproteobacteria bacterium]|nr:cytochrome c biogenesis protein CcdA [Alphaproteobacteria bacterium]
MLPVGSATVAFVAGILSVLSPCVLPILPIALGGAVAAHRFGPIALSAGLAVSFTAIGLFVATLGFSVGLGSGAFQMVGAVLLVVMGIILMVPRLQVEFATVAGPLGNWAEQRFGGFSTAGLSGQFGLGLLFGAVWSPCAGPTLGAAALMAANGHNLIQVTFIMLAFGIGAAVPLLALGTISRVSLMRWRGKIAGSSYGAKAFLGAILVLFGVLILSGLNQTIEAYLVSHSPDWLLQLTTRY